MKRLFGLLVVSLSLIPAPASAETPVTIIGGTPEDRRFVADVFAWPELPPLTQPITVTIYDDGMLSPGVYALSGCSGIALGRFAAQAEFMILHEYAHVWDCQTLTPEWHRFISGCVDLDCETPGPEWRAGDYGDRMDERFAQSFAGEIEHRHYGTPIRPNVWGLMPSKLVERAINANTPCTSPAHPRSCM